MHEYVSRYYGQILKHSQDLNTSVACEPGSALRHIRKLLPQIHEAVSTRYYGCGTVIPELLDGAHVLDLGCGAGRDCFLLSALVGERGSVTGVDMTDEQLEVARRYVDFHTRQFGYRRPNVSFLKGRLEQLDRLDLPAGSFDVIVSNRALNLCIDKAAVLRAVYRLLKPGGEMYFSDVYADRRIPPALAENPILYGEGLSGALYWNDFLHLARKTGFRDPRLVSDSPVDIRHEELAAKIQPIRFYSATYRLFKLEELEPAWENYGQAVIYRGTIGHFRNEVVLDKHHRMPAGQALPVCGNTYRILHDTRFQPHFKFIGGWETHHGIFAGSGHSMPFDS